jgi:RNA polymerase sigma-70 factor (ECF subfamily)
MRTPQMSIKDKKQPDEVKLLKRARKLDQDALTRIYQNYHDAIYRYVYHHLGNAQTAEDLTSDVFRHFLQALRNGGGPTRQLKAWLYRVAHNLIVDELRRRKHRNHQSLDETLGDTLRDDALGLDRLVGDAIAVERVRRAEGAEITGRTVGAVKSLQHRGLDALRAQLAAPAPRLTRLSGERAVAPSFAS